MGTRYAVASGNWDNPAVWSMTSGGTPGALPPGPEDDAIFNAASGSINVAATATIGQQSAGIGQNSIVVCRNLTCTGFVGTISGTFTINIFGNLTLVSGMTFTHTGGFAFKSESHGTTQTIISAGKTLGPIDIIIVDGLVELGDNLICGAITVYVGRFSTSSSNYSLTCGTISTYLTYAVVDINFNSSSVICSGNLTVTDYQTYTYNFSNSTITFSGSASTLTAPTNQVFNTVVFNNTGAAGTCAIASSGHTFTNLTINGPSSGIRLFSLAADITVTGTLTISGNGGGSQLRVVSNTFRTQRTITAAAYAGSATDVTWRDIVVAGAAAPISGTRFGDMGNNSGITMSAPKTVYWNLAGSQTWTANAWATTSGGSPNIDNYPLPQDTGVFDNAGSITTLTLSGDVMGTADMSARTSAMTITTTGTTSIYGGWKFGSGCTTTAGANTLTISPISSNFIDCNSITFNFPVTIDTLSTVTLSSAFLMAANRALTHNRGTFDANNYNVTCGSFASSTTNVRTINAGSGVWSISGVGTTTVNQFTTIWNLSDTTNLTWNPGTAEILFSTTSNGNRAFYGGGLYFHKFTIGGATGSGTVFMDNAANYFGEIASIKTVSHTIRTDGDYTIGYFNIKGSAGAVFNFERDGGSALWTVLSQASNIDYLSFTLWEFWPFGGIIVYTGANSGAILNGIAQPLPAPRTLYWVGGSGSYENTARWSLSSGGAGGEPMPTWQDDVIFDSNSSAGSYTVTLPAGSIPDRQPSARCRNITIGAPASGNVTFTPAGGTVIFNISGNLDITGGANVIWNTSATAYTYFAGASGNFTLNSGGKTLGQIIFNGNGKYTLTSALTTNATLNLFSGELDTGSYNVTGTTFNSDYRVKRALTLGSSTITMSSATPVSFGTTVANQNTFTVSPGTSSFSISAASSTFSGNSKSFYNVTFSSTAVIINGNNTFNNVSFTSTTASTHTINGSNTFNNLTFTAPASDGITYISLGANQTISGTLTASGATVLRRLALISDTLGTARTLSVATYAASAQDTDFRDIRVTGGAAPLTGTRLGDWGGNTGITTATPKTVYWNLSGSQAWTATGWATLSGGSPAADNFPLAQDTAIFDDAGSAGTVTVTSTYALPSINASARTSAMTLSAGANMTTYGGIVLGSGVTTSWSTRVLIFSGRGSYNINSAAKTMPYILMAAPGGTLTLQASLTTGDTTSTGYFDLQSGTFDLNEYSITTGRFLCNTTSVRTLDFGSSGAINVGRTSSTGPSDSVINMRSSSNLTILGTSQVNVTANTASTRYLYPSNRDINVNVTSGSGIIRFDSPANTVKNLSFTGSTTSNITIAETLNIIGDLTLVSPMTFTTTNANFYLNAAGANGTWNMAGNTVTIRIRLHGTLKLGANLTTDQAIYFNGGRLDLNGYNFTTPSYLFTGDGAANVANFVKATKNNGGEVIISTNNTTLVNGSDILRFVSAYNDKHTINATYSGGTGTRTFTLLRMNNTPLFTNFMRALTIKISAGTDTIALTEVVPNVDFTGFSGTWPNATRNLAGDVTLSSTMTFTAGTLIQRPIVSDARPIKINTAGLTFDCPVISYASLPGGIELNSAITFGSTRTVNLLFGALITSNYSLSLGIFESSNSNPRAIDFGSSTVTVVGAGTSWSLATSTNFLSLTNTSTISMTSGSAKTFAGGGRSYPKLNQGGAGSLSITGTNTFADISNTNPTACTIIFPNVTTTVANFTASGTSGNLLTLARTGASGTFTLSKTSGVVGVDFISVSNSVATGGATWYAGANSTNGGNNTGWIFSAAPTSSGNMFFIF
jgi:hypothetical protein